MTVVDPLTAALNLGETLIGKIWPDPAQQAAEQRKLLELHQSGDLAELQAHVQLMVKQADINLADAKSGNAFQAGWRPAIGWVGALSLALTYIPKALLQTYIWGVQSLKILEQWDGVSALAIPAFPDLGVTDIIGLLTSMLGIAALRTYEKKKGVDTKPKPRYYQNR